MNARRFDALTVAMTSGAQRASRRRVLRGLAMLAAIGVARRHDRTARSQRSHHKSQDDSLCHIATTFPLSDPLEIDRLGAA